MVKLVDIDTKQIKSLRVDMAQRESKLAHNIKKSANDVLLNAESDSKALAPRDGGRLESSITSSKAKYESGYVSGVVGSNLVYALRRHEEAPRIGTYNKYEDGVKYEGYYVNGRGEITRSKPNVGGFKPGRKYLYNSSLLNEMNWRNSIAEAIADTYRGLG